MTSPRKPTAGFWITVALVVVLVVYPLSVGPVYWIDRWVTGPGLFNDVCGVVYAPLRTAYRIGPKPLRDALDWYARIWRID